MLHVIAGEYGGMRALVFREWGVVWRKFEQFDLETNFMKWACVIARFEALAYRRKMARDRLVFREDVFDLITDEFFVKNLRIGNGEIGNWGEPFKEDPNWAIRNLIGRMDEIAIYKAALSGEEVAKIFEQS